MNERRVGIGVGMEEGKEMKTGRNKGRKGGKIEKNELE